MSATQLAAPIRSRQGSSQEVVEAYLRRIEAVNRSVNAVTVVLGEEALEGAKAADAWSPVAVIFPRSGACDDGRAATGRSAVPDVRRGDRLDDAREPALLLVGVSRCHGPSSAQRT